jgi:hypothetical protein
MASSIGIYNFVFVKGATNVQIERLESFSRPGVDGESFRAIGKRADITNFTSFSDLPTLGAAGTQLNLYAALVSQVVTVVDDLGYSWTNMLVLSVRQTLAKAIKTGVGGLYVSPLAVQTCSWEFKQLL